MTSIDPKNSRVVLIGCGKYDDKKFSPDAASASEMARKITNNIFSLANIFRNPCVIGVPNDQVIEVLNPSSPLDVTTPFEKAAKEATDTLIVYFAGHGLICHNSVDLGLAVVRTDYSSPDNSVIKSTSLLTIIRKSTAKKRILILDCCFSGRIITNFMGAGDASGAAVSLTGIVAANFAVSGVYLLAACGPGERATFMHNEHHTDFTGELISILQNGVSEGPEYISTKYIFTRICTTKAAMPGMPTPIQLIIDRGGEIVVAVNLQHPPSTLAETVPSSTVTKPSIPSVVAADCLARLVADAVPVTSAKREIQARSSLLWPSTVLAAIFGGLGVVLALLQSKGWPPISLDMLPKPIGGALNWDWKSLAFLVGSPIGAIWVGVLAGAVAGCLRLRTKTEEETAVKVAAVRAGFWSLVRTRDPLVWFLLKYWSFRLFAAIGAAVLIGLGSLIGALLGGDLFGPDYGVKLGAIIGATVVSRYPTWGITVSFAASGFAFFVFLFVLFVTWLTGIGDPGRDAERTWYFSVWSFVMVLCAADSKRHISEYEYSLAVPSELNWMPIRWIGRLWILARIFVLLLAGLYWRHHYSEQFARLDGHNDVVSGTKFTSDGMILFTSSWDKSVQAWFKDDSQLKGLSIRQVTEIRCLAISTDGKLVAVGRGRVKDPKDPDSEAEDCVIWVWNMRNNIGPNNPRELRHNRPVLSIAISPTDPNTLISTAGDGVIVWSLASGKPIEGPPFDGRGVRWAGHTSTITALAFSPDGRRVASASKDGTVRVRDMDDPAGANARVFNGHDGFVKCVAYSPDGRWIASGGKDGTVRLWDVWTGAAAGVFRGHSKEVNGIAFSPRSDRLVSGGDDNTVRVWAVGTDHEIRRFTGHTGSVGSVDVTQDGKLIVAGDSGGTVRLWRMPP